MYPNPISIRDVPNSGFRLFGRIRIVLWTIQLNRNTNMNSWMTRNIVMLLIMSKNRNDQIKSLWHAVVTWSRQYWPRGTQFVGCFQHGGEFCCRPTIRIRYDDAIWPNTNRLFRPLFGPEANTYQIFGTCLISICKYSAGFRFLGGPMLDRVMGPYPGCLSSHCTIATPLEVGRYWDKG